MNTPELNVLPPLIDGVEVYFNMETINYEYGTDIDEFGDREIIDVSRIFKVKINIPKVSFIEWIETLCILKNNKVVTTHLYTKELFPYAPNHSSIWGYFDQVIGNLLTNGYKYRNEDKVRMYVYYIKDFNYFVIIKLLSHQDIISYSTTKSEEA